MRGVIGKKIGMTQIFDQDGVQIPVTVVELSPNYVVQVKTESGKDGYNAVKLAAGAVRAKTLTKPELGVFKAAGIDAQRTVVEFRVTADEIAQYKEGEVVDTSFLSEGGKVNVRGTSMGKGYAGVMKRHGFKGFKESTHGTHETKRHGGSIGQASWPARVFKNKKMAGQMGNGTVTVKNVKIVAHYVDDKVLLLKGAVPGPKNAVIQITEVPPKLKKKA